MKAIRFAFSALCFGLIVYLCLFKVGNSDFWWHVKAGQMLRESGWISLDPFAYTRVGEAYLASHEWLAQVLMSIFYDAGGWGGITIARIVLVLLAFGIPLQIHRKNYWPNLLLVVLAVASARPALTDRPQLFTFAMFSLVLYFCILYIEGDKKRQRGVLLSLPIITVVWSNLHGAASLIGITIIGALLCNQVFTKAKETRWLLLSFVACGIGLMLTPVGIENITYLSTLLSDQSHTMIAEWQPSPIGLYLQNTIVFWLISISALLLGRRNLIFSTLTLFGIGYLSTTAARHEALFLLTALAIAIYQLRFVSLWDNVVKRQASCVAFSVLFLIVGLYAVAQSHRYTMRDDSFGLGVFTPLAGASAFIDQENITGNMFNNYNAGGELLYHNHKVFLDGRNLDFGYEYIQRAVDAGTDLSLWNELDSEYNFTHAVIYYSLEGDRNPMPYIDMLQSNSKWSLQYLDDWSAVYTKDATRNTYAQITPRMLYATTMPEEITLGNLRILEQEVLRIIEQSPSSKKAPAYIKEILEAFGVPAKE